jgi:serine/threonine-protein kinase
MPLGVSSSFAGYTVVRLLGAGGMGEVYLAQHPRLPRSDALKLLGSNVSADPSFRQRFLREANLASKLWHPHIVGVHDRGEYEGQLWISMDFVDGADAGGLIARRYPAGMPQDLVAAVVTAVASALDYAHKQGLLHRDVKPANILLTNVDDEVERRILLTDFGIARTVDDVSGLTATNMTVGTVIYTAPEQLLGKDIDGRADQYSLAVTAYHLLTGSPPFPESTPAAVISRHLLTEPPPLANTRPELAALDPVLATALAKDRNNRFASCSDFARALAAPASRDTAAPTAFAPTMPAPVNQIVSVIPNVPGSARPQSPSPPSPGWYRDPSGQPGTYKDHHGLQTAPKPRGSRPAALLWVLGIAVALVVIGLVLFLLSQDKGSSPSSGSTSAITAGPTASAAPSPTFSQSAFPSLTVAPPPQQRSWTAVIVGTCDEGGTCGVKQRTAPYTDAPRLVPNDLQDGNTVTVVCQTTGDVRASAGHGSSNVWYRLGNGAYVNLVYTNLPASGIPPCS